MLDISRQAFYSYLHRKDLPWKYQYIADEMHAILDEDIYNDTYGRYRMHKALKLKHQCNSNFKIPSERTIYRIMDALNLSHRPKRNPHGITKADKEARKSDDIIRRNFKATAPLTKCITDISEIKAKNGKLYVSAIFDCFDSAVVGLALDTNMKATLVEKTLVNACKAYPSIRGCVVHSDRGTQYTSELYRNAVRRYGIQQSMNSASGRCHDNARCESMWARLKEELFYSRNIKSTYYTVEELKVMVWRYYISYWNNRRICSSNNGLPPMVKRQCYYAMMEKVA